MTSEEVQKETSREKLCNRLTAPGNKLDPLRKKERRLIKRRIFRLEAQALSHDDKDITMNEVEIAEAKSKLKIKYDNIKIVFQQLSMNAPFAELDELLPEQKSIFEYFRNIGIRIVGLTPGCTNDEILSGLREILRGIEQLLYN